MKKLVLVGAILASLVLCNTRPGSAQGTSQPRFEYAIVKWDGPDRLFYNLPDKFEMVHLEKTGVTIPREAQDEEWCLAYACNKMAKDGWEPVSLDSRRIVFRRGK